MAGLADLFGGGGMFGGGLDELLTPQMKQQMAMRGLMAAAGAFGQAAMPSRMPIPIGAALGQAGAAMSGAQDQGLETALKMLLTSGKLQELKSKIDLQKQLTSGAEPPMFAMPSAAAAPTLPGAIAPDMGGGMRAGGALIGDPLALIEKYESGGQNVMQGVVPPGGGYNPSVGRVTGPSTAQGFYQITNTTWRETAPKAGVDLDQYPTAMSAPKEVQAKVAQTLFNEQGFKPWAPYNPRLAAAIRNSETSIAPVPPANNGGLPTRIGMIGEGANAVLADMDTGRPIQATPGGPIQMVQSAPQSIGQPAAALSPTPPPSQTPYGNINPAYVQWAQTQAKFRTALGIPVPSHISEAAALPFKYAEPGANVGLQERLAAAKARGAVPAQMTMEQFKAQLARETARQGQGLTEGPGGAIQELPNYGPALAGVTSAVEGAKPTAEQKDYRAYVEGQQSRGLPVQSFGEWDMTRRKAGATMINTTEGLEAAQTKARIAIDTKAATDVGEHALLARRLMPVVNEIGRIADKTPGGYAGPMAASAAKTFSTLGLPVSEGMSNAEAMVALSQRLIPLVREPGATAASEMDAYLRSTPGLMQSEEGRKKIVEITKAVMQRTVDIAKVYRENVGAPDLFEKLATLDKPILTNEQRAAIEAAGAGSAGATPNASGVITTPYGTIREVK